MVARSIARGCRVLILDEPTAMLTPAEADRLFALMDKLKAAGRPCCTSPTAARVFHLADHIQVLRDGAHVASWRSTETDPTGRSPHGRHASWETSPPLRQGGEPDASSPPAPGYGS
ncbi:hypothetical protein GCM10023238_32490 [Streptomyces heliomycini]